VNKRQNERNFNNKLTKPKPKIQKSKKRKKERKKPHTERQKVERVRARELQHRGIVRWPQSLDVGKRPIDLHWNQQLIIAQAKQNLND
jgi:hypothetical protein